MLLKFQLNDEGFTIINPEEVNFQTSVEYIKCHFDIKTSMWSDMDALCAVFKNLTYNKYDQVMLDSNHNCFIDPKIYRRGGTVSVKLVGDKYLPDHIHSTTHQTGIISFRIKDGIVVPVRVPDKYDVFVAEYEIAKKDVQDTIDDLTTKAQEGYFDGAGITEIIFNPDYTVTCVLSDGRTYTSSGSMRGPKGDKGDTGAPGLDGANGADGRDGRDGTDGVSVSNVTFNNDDSLTITLDDGNSYTSGSLRGVRGYSILSVGANPIAETHSQGLYYYKLPLSTVLSLAHVDKVYVGDIIKARAPGNLLGASNASTYLYMVTSLSSTYVYLSGYTNIKGDKGDPGIHSIGKLAVSIHDPVTIPAHSFLPHGLAEFVSTELAGKELLGYKALRLLDSSSNVLPLLPMSWYNTSHTDTDNVTHYGLAFMLYNPTDDDLRVDGSSRCTILYVNEV